MDRQGRPSVAHVIRGSAYGVVAVGINGAGALAYWTVVARSEAPATVGAAQELFTAVLVVAYLTTLGLPVSVARFCTDTSGRSAGLFRRATVATTVSSVVGAVALAAIAGPNLLEPVGGSSFLGQVAVLAAAVTGLSLAVLVEVRLIALRRWDWVVARVVAVVMLRFPLLALGGDDRAWWAFVVVAGLPALSGVVGALVLHRMEPGARVVAVADRREWWRFSAVNYVGLLASQGPQFLVPLVVAVAVDDAAFAPFYLAWGATAFVFVVPHMLGQTLLSESSRVEVHRRLTLTSAAASLGFTGMVTLLAFGAEPVVRALLGSDYLDTVGLLPWLLGASIPWSVTCTALAVARARHDHAAVLRTTVSFAVATMVATGVGVASGGTDGAAVGWFVGNAIAGATGVVFAAASALNWGTQRTSVGASEPLPSGARA